MTWNVVTGKKRADWRHYLTPDEKADVSKLESAAERLKKRLRALAFDIHFARNRAIQRRRSEARQSHSVK